MTKRKRTLYLAFGIVLAFIAVLLLAVFIYTRLRDAHLTPFSPIQKLSAAGAVFMWITILGAGIPGTLMLRRVILDARGADDDEDDEPGDYDYDYEAEAEAAAPDEDIAAFDEDIAEEEPAETEEDAAEEEKE